MTSASCLSRPINQNQNQNVQKGEFFSVGYFSAKTEPKKFIAYWKHVVPLELGKLPLQGKRHFNND